MCCADCSGVAVVPLPAWQLCSPAGLRQHSAVTLITLGSFMESLLMDNRGCPACWDQTQTQQQQLLIPHWNCSCSEVELGFPGGRNLQRLLLLPGAAFCLQAGISLCAGS